MGLTTVRSSSFGAAGDEPRPLHVAVIPDGNGRWAAARGLPRTAGHLAGVEAVRRLVDAAPQLDIGTLSLYVFSADNWERPPAEVQGLFALLQSFLEDEAKHFIAAGVRLRVIGRRDRLPQDLRRAVAATEKCTAAGRRLRLRLAVDYSAQDAILRAACRMISSLEISRREFARLLGLASYGEGPAPNVDLLVRTGGEQRLSDFLLWECAYAELFFSSKLWPDFQAADLAGALEEFHRRERRFGRIAEAVAG
ncbi:MAG TPA: polyprenyl diphosphate synthase [Candidatus Acidoferrales bacterium]|nr:polyprenyl diphosphate synthase [Candidatus Acidoferrales bacterium]